MNLVLHMCWNVCTVWFYCLFQDVSEKSLDINLLNISLNCDHTRTAVGYVYALPRLPPNYMWAGYRTVVAYAQEKGVYHGPLEVFLDYVRDEWLIKRTPEIVSVFNEEYTATQGMESKNSELNVKVKKHPPFWDCHCEYLVVCILKTI